ncbi:MFS transporter, ACDE family, multidrug resistance protein [Desulfofundulus australicus DSM 11792]|uniref:MFS transporter, ACDE family, multidrug resistance protein n=1 Tax=Desulfofundulus australicus DSM 11792 TaxID=1121425 RepID=A0A1M5DKY8_9FIRM|nr:MFS transporter [Desulfofundulus australicus]SHF67610.1 MFS transporter, ACDE family, multidrug resistance protein [Desulfofundulus australicus DSM 11792]
MKQQKSTLVLAALSGVPFIMVLGNSMIIPVLPAIKEALHLTQFKVSLLITLFSVPAGIIIPLAGFLSDRFGRKKVIVPALILYGLGGILAGLAAIFLKSMVYQAILAGRILQGMGAAGTAPIAMALTGDLYTGKQRATALGIIEAANGLGKVVSPVLGALLGLITWYATFLFFPLVIIPVVLGVYFLVSEPEQNRQAQSVREYLKSIARVFEKKSAMLLTSFLGGAVALLTLFGVLFFLSEHLETVFRLNGVRKGMALAVPVLFMSSTSYLTGRLIKKRLALMKWLVVTGLALISGALTLMGFYRTTYLFFIAISLAGIGTGLALPCLNTIITSSTAAQRRGLVTSLYGGVRFLGVALGPPLFGLLMNYGLPLMFWSTATLAGVAALLAVFLIRVRDMKEPAAEEKSGPVPYKLQPVPGMAARKPWKYPEKQE